VSADGSTRGSRNVRDHLMERRRRCGYIAPTWPCSGHRRDRRPHLRCRGRGGARDL
jgi:hypothetical protein